MKILLKERIMIIFVIFEVVLSKGLSFQHQTCGKDKVEVNKTVKVQGVSPETMISLDDASQQPIIYSHGFAIPKTENIKVVQNLSAPLNKSKNARNLVSHKRGTRPMLIKVKRKPKLRTSPITSSHNTAGRSPRQDFDTTKNNVVGRSGSHQNGLMFKLMTFKPETKQIANIATRVKNYFSSKFMPTGLALLPKHIAGISAIGSLVIGALVSSSITGALRRRSDNGGFRWLRSQKLWNTNENAFYDYRDSYRGNRDYYDSEKDVWQTPNTHLPTNDIQYDVPYPERPSYSSWAHYNNHYTSTPPNGYYYDRTAPQQPKTGRNKYTQQNMYLPPSPIRTPSSKQPPDRQTLKRIENRRKKESYEKRRQNNTNNNKKHQSKFKKNKSSIVEVSFRPSPIFPSYQNKLNSRNRINKRDIIQGKQNIKKTRK